MKIVLARHGKSKIEDYKKTSPRGFGDWIRHYDNTGIDTTHAPTEKIIFEAKQTEFVVCSNLKRSLESASLIGIEVVDLECSGFREAGMPYGNWNILRMTPKAWSVIFRVMWLLGYSSNTESFKEAKTRSKECAKKLMALAERHSSVLLVGHGIMNRLIAKELISLGWQGPPSPGKKYWEFGVYEYATD